MYSVWSYEAEIRQQGGQYTYKSNYSLVPGANWPRSPRLATLKRYTFDFNEVKEAYYTEAHTTIHLDCFFIYNSAQVLC